MMTFKKTIEFFDFSLSILCSLDKGLFAAIFEGIMNIVLQENSTISSPEK